MNQEELKKLFDYEYGDLVWKVTNSNRATQGSVAGCLNEKGYVTIQINGKRYYRGRLTWIYFNGDIPKGKIIDHINRCRNDDRIENLRLTDYSGNAVNKTFKNKTGYRGVKKNGKGFQAKITINGKKVYLGTFKTAKLAYQNYLKKAKEIHGDFLPV